MTLPCSDPRCPVCHPRRVPRPEPPRDTPVMLAFGLAGILALFAALFVLLPLAAS